MFIIIKLKIIELEEYVFYRGQIGYHPDRQWQYNLISILVKFSHIGWIYFRIKIIVIKIIHLSFVETHRCKHNVRSFIYHFSVSSARWLIPSLEKNVVYHVVTDLASRGSKWFPPPLIRRVYLRAICLKLRICSGCACHCEQFSTTSRMILHSNVLPLTYLPSIHQRYHHQG